MYRNDRRQHRSELRGHTFRNNQACCSKVEGRLLVVPFFYRGEQFVAQSDIKCKSRSNFPIILREEGIHLMVIVDVVQVVDAAAVSQSDEERSETRAPGKYRAGIRVVSETGTEGQCAARRRWLKNGELLGADVGPEFERVSAVHPVQ